NHHLILHSCNPASFLVRNLHLAIRVTSSVNLARRRHSRTWPSPPSPSQRRQPRSCILLLLCPRPGACPDAASASSRVARVQRHAPSPPTGGRRPCTPSTAGPVDTRPAQRSTR